MSEAARLAGLGVGAMLLLVTLRQAKPEMAAVFSLAAGAVILLVCAEKLSAVAGTLRALAGQAGLGEGAALLGRVAGIGALCQLGAQLCRDACESGMGEKIELGGKMMMLSLALPVAASLLEAVCGLLR